MGPFSHEVFHPGHGGRYLVAQLVCRLKHLIISLSRRRKAIEDVGPDTKFFVDSLDANGWKEGAKGDATLWQQHRSCQKNGR